MVPRSRKLLFIALCAQWACALIPVAPTLPDERVVQAGGERFVVRFQEVDRKTALGVAHSLEIAEPRVTRWGRFTAPVSILVRPTHDALEHAVHRLDYPWLRAWARYDSIDLQSPRTWSYLGSVDAQVTELLTHEVTHCLMYQLSGTASDWMYKRIPLWFREGMASVTAHQGYRRPTDEELWRYLRENPGKDPIRDADALYQTEDDIVYGAAHRAFAFLDERYGDGAIRDLLSRMRAGADFDAAFHASIGITASAFVDDFMNYIRWQGWRGKKAAQPERGQPPAVGAGE